MDEFEHGDLANHFSVVYLQTNRKPEGARGVIVLKDRGCRRRGVGSGGHNAVHADNVRLVGGGIRALLKNDSTVRRAAGVMSTLLWTGYDASDRSLFTFRSRKENENEPKKNEMKIEKVVKSIKCVV